MPGFSRTGGYVDASPGCVVGRGGGQRWPDQLRLVERYRRTSFTTLDAELTIIDPVVYTKPWTTKATIQLSPGTELWEYLCVTSESEAFNEQRLKVQVGAT